MNLVVATSSADPLGGVFAQAYAEAGGPAPALIVEQTNRKEIGFSGGNALLAAVRVFGLSGSLRLLAARKLHQAWFAQDWKKGLQRPWVQSLAAGKSEVVRCRSINDPEVVQRLKDVGFDLLVSIGSPFIIKQEVLALARIGALNIHNARLPKYRGHFGTFWEIYQGESSACVTIHEMVHKVDMGRIIRMACLDVSSSVSFLDLMIEKKQIGGRLLAELIRGVEGAGRLPDDAPAQVEQVSGYYNFPNASQLLRFRYPRGQASPAKTTS